MRLTAFLNAAANAHLPKGTEIIGHERMSPAFEKFHLSDHRALHHFTQEEPHADPHSHPADFTTTILCGGYVEEVFTITDDGWTSQLIERLPGHTYEIAAEHIHRIVSLPDGECWTLVGMGAHRRTSRFWRFGAEVMARDWDRGEWVRCLMERVEHTSKREEVS